MSKFEEQLNNYAKELHLEDMVPATGATTQAPAASGDDPMAQIYAHPEVQQAMQQRNTASTQLHAAIAKAAQDLTQKQSTTPQQGI